ncbi:MFS general substrate transporter, partial [Auriscalpium vulgare]
MALHSPHAHDLSTDIEEKTPEVLDSDKFADEDSASELSIDFATYHDEHAGRLIVDPEEARLEFGEKVAARLKLTEDGTKVLWPQPTDSPEDPQNWSARRKTLQLVIITIASFGLDFNHGIGIAAVWALAKQFNTTTGVINNLTTNWSIFVVGWGCIFSVILIRRYGRLPVIFWSQILALSFLVGCTFAPNLKTFAGTHHTTQRKPLFSSPMQQGLYVVTDMYPFHLQARKLNIWTMSFIIAPFMSPFALGFLVARADWRWGYGVGNMYLATVLLLIVFLGEETMYDRKVKPIPPRPSHGLRYRVETLLGVTGAKMAKHRATW